MATTGRFGIAQFGTGKFGVHTAETGRILIGFEIRKKLGKEGSPDPKAIHGIYQMRKTKKGKIPIRMKFYAPSNPETEAQQANRQKFADAMTAWAALPAEEKEEYDQRGKEIGLFGKNLFVKKYFAEN